MSTWIKSRFRPFSLPVLPRVFRKGYGLVSCKPLSWYTPNREAMMRVPWPWIKASHPVRGHGCFRLGPRGGHPLKRADINLIPCYSRLWSPRLKVFLESCLGWFLASWGGMGVYWLDVFLPKYRKRNKSFVTTETRWLWVISTNSAESKILWIILSMSKYCVQLILSSVSLSDKNSGEPHEC